MDATTVYVSSCPPPAYDSLGLQQQQQQPWQGRAGATCQDTSTAAGAAVVYPISTNDAEGWRGHENTGNPPPSYQTSNAAAAAPSSTNAFDLSVDNGSLPADSPWVGRSFSDRKIRHGFIRKVYLILLVQLCITVGIICLFLFCKPLKNWMQNHGWFFWIAFVIFIVLYIVLACCPNARRRVPANFIFLVVFTLAMSFVAGIITSYYDTEIVLICMGITAAVCLAISIFAIQTKIDFTLCSGLLFALCMILLYAGITCLIFSQVGYYRYLNVLYGALAAGVFSLFLVFDTQRVVGGKNRHFQLSPEEYITGAMELYLDIVYMLLILVSCAGIGSN